MVPAVFEVDVNLDIDVNRSTGGTWVVEIFRKTSLLTMNIAQK